MAKESYWYPFCGDSLCPFGLGVITSVFFNTSSYPAKLALGCNFLTKSPRGMEVIFLHRSHSLKNFLYVCMRVCMYVCLRSRGHNFYFLAPNFVHR